MAHSIRLSALGFCGVDDSVEPLLLAALSCRYPWVEWGVLFREEKQGQPRYASQAWLETLAPLSSGGRMRLAGHLCSGHVTQLLQGDASFVARMHQQVLTPQSRPP